MIRPRITSTTVFGLLLLAPLATVAEGTEGAVGDREESEPVYETVVVARRAPEDLFLSNRSSNTADVAQLREETPRTAPEALRRENGVFVQQTNHGGGAPIIRGMIGPQNLILIDGVRLNNSVHRTGPTQYLNLIDTLSLERLEVLRGPGSVLYGSDAMGGVVQGITLTPEPTGRGQRSIEAEALARYASANRGRTLHTHTSGSANGFGGLLGLSYKVFDDLSGGREVGVQPYSGYSTWSAHGHLGHAFLDGPLEGWKVRAVYVSTRIEDAGRTDKLWDENKLQMYDNADDLVYIRASGDLDDLRTGVEVTVSYQHFDEIKDNISMDDDLVTRLETTRDETTVHTVGADLKLDTQIVPDRLSLQYGGLFYCDFVDAISSSLEGTSAVWEPLPTSVYPSGSTYDTYGAYLMVRGDPVSTGSGHVLRVTGGYRFHGVAGAAPADSALEAVDFGFSGHVFTAGLQYLYQDIATAAFTFSQGFRAPNLAEAVMLGDTGKYFHIPNGDLEPESSDTLELLGRLRVGRVTFGLTGYLSFLDNLIKREETAWEGQDEIGGKPVVANVNAGKGLLMGFESAMRVDLGGGFSAGGHLTHTWGEERVGDGDDVPLTRIPPMFGLVDLRYDTPASAGLDGFLLTDLLWALPQDRLSPEDETDVRIPEGGTPGWASWNAGAGLSILDHLQIVLRVENLLNAKYKYHGSGLYAPGTNAVLTARGYF